MMKVRWRCRHYFGGHSSVMFDLEDFCGWVFITDVGNDVWDLENACAVCPLCNSFLTQKEDLPEVVL